jgi:hypothetical protein
LKKIRGLKRRSKNIEFWFKQNKAIDFSILNRYDYYYCKAKINPWANLLDEQPYPTNYRKQIFSKLLTIFFSWKQQLDKSLLEYRLELWLFDPRFIQSQVVVSIGEKMTYYKNLFPIADELKKFPIEKFKDDESRINQLSWALHEDNDYYLESDLLEVGRYTDQKQYFINQRFYRKLSERNTKYRIIENENGEKDKLFAMRKGDVWVGLFK